MKFGQTLKAMALAGALMLGLAGVAPTAQAADQNMATVLKGTWIGTYEGYWGAKYASGQEKLIFTKTKGRSAIGTWQSRSSATVKWSAPQPVTLTIFPNDASGYVVFGADSEGVYSGELSSDGAMTVGYAYVADAPATLQFLLKKR